MKAIMHSARLKIIVSSIVVAASLSGCAKTNEYSNFMPADQKRADAVTSEARTIAEDGIKLLKAGKFEEASNQFNAALKLDITNSSLQFMNGLAYHLRALKGDTTYYPLAEQGYQLAVQFDNTNWMAHYYAGLLRMEQRNFAGAQENFSEALLYRENDPDILYNMAATSYYAQDPLTAAAVLGQARQIEPKNPNILQASAVVMAALGNNSRANTYVNRYAKITNDERKTNFLKTRVASWKGVYDRAGNAVTLTDANNTNIQLAQSGMNDMNDGMGGAENLNNDSTQEDAAAYDPYKMAIVDVVIIRTEEDITTSKGVNLLNGLTLQFGSTGLTTAGISFSSSKKNTFSADSTNTITRAINIPSINYSLNIANTGSARNEILARPTLVALANEQSEFFSGVEVDAAAVGGANSDGSTISVQKEIGVKLALQPEFLDDGRIKLNVAAERTFLTTPNTSSITFDLRIDTSKTMVNANVVMDFGETLILSGLSEKETERTRDGVPLLQDVPGLQYFFSNRTTRDFQKSVLILLTPRPPSYTYQSKDQRKNSLNRMGKDERSLSELQARYSDWFKPYPNWASVFHHMQDNTLYREFRTGDVTMERWANMETISSRLKQALEFLYY
ncbi:MAG: hypothetical protein OEX17_03260 [Rhodospirillaceae bacterium]|nr:hypothetical protein [Rhodospirillaceae bacterium]